MLQSPTPTRILRPSCPELGIVNRLGDRLWVKALKRGFSDYETPRSSFGLLNCLGPYAQSRTLLLFYLLPSVLGITVLSVLERSLPLSLSISSWFGVLLLNLQAAMWGMILAKAIVYLRHSMLRPYRGRSRPWVSGGLALAAALMFLNEIGFYWVLISVSLAGFVLLSSLHRFVSRPVTQDPLVLTLALLLSGFFGFASTDALIPYVYQSSLLTQAHLTPEEFTRGLIWAQLTPLGSLVAPIYWGYSVFSWLGLVVGIMATIWVPLLWYSLRTEFRHWLLGLNGLLKLGFGLFVGLGVLWVFALFDVLLVLSWPPQSFFLALLSAALFVRRWNSLKIMSVGFVVALTQLLAEAISTGDL